MPKELPQITFDFSEPSKERPREPLSGAPVPPPARKGRQGRKSIKAVEAEAELVELPSDEVIFSRQYWPIGEVAQMFRVNTSLIRHWEKEFDVLDPRKNRKGDRLFKPEDVKNLELIYDLLRRRKFTIEGAKDYLRRSKRAGEKHEAVQSLLRLRAFLQELRANL